MQGQHIGIRLGRGEATEIVLLRREAYEGRTERVRRLSRIGAKRYWVQPASIGYHACERIDGLTPDFQWWALTRSGAERKLARKVGAAIFDDYVPERAE